MRRLLGAGVACSLVMIAGCKPTESVQWGYRGNSMTQLYNPKDVAKLADINAIPEPEPSEVYDPTFPMATEVHQNIQVLTDLNALELARLMNAMTTWVAPEQGCEYCHNTENLADDSKYTKLVARQMLKMTRAINANWKDHVVETGVTCWTCHRGQAVPSDIWFTTPPPKTPSAHVTGWKGGQNVGGVKINGNAALPYDPLTPFLMEANDIRIQGTGALPDGNRQSTKQAEWTYALMMYISNSLGVNCTYCHQTRAMARWDESTPQRVTAWHGIRMVRSLNQDHLEPLKDLYPANRLGPTGDAPKAACATCHKGTYKPLYGQSMLGDYPSLRGVLPGRLTPDPTQGGAVTLASAPEGAGIASMEERVSMAEAIAAGAPVGEAVAVVSAEAEAAAPDAEDTAPSADEAAVAAEPATDEPTTVDDGGAGEAGLTADAAAEAAPQGEAAAEGEGTAVPVDAVASAEQVEVEASTTAQAAPGATDEPAATPTQTEAQGPASAQALLADLTAPGAPATAGPTFAGDMSVAEMETVLTSLLEKLRAVRAELDALRGGPAPTSPAEATGAPEATPAAAPERHEGGPDDADGEPEKASSPAAPAEASAADGAGTEAVEAHARALAAEIEALRAEVQRKAAQLGDADAAADALDDAEDQLTAMRARLEQQTTALKQQLALVRAQRDSVAADVSAELRATHAKELGAAGTRLKALQARLEQQDRALQQQLEVVRAQRDDARAEAQSRIAAREHAAAIAAAERQIAAIEARLGQQTHALNQQLDLVREQRDQAQAEVAARIPADDHAKAIAALEQRIRAVQARLDQNVLALEQQLRLVRTRRDDAKAQAAERIAALEQAHAEALAALKARIAAGDARQAQERQALQQQLALVREQRDTAKAEAEAEIAQLNQRLAETEAKLGKLRGTLAATEAAQAEAQEAASQAQALADTAAAIGGEVSDDGIVVQLGGDRLRFASGSATLPAGDLPELERTAKLLAERTDLTARIEGHTDSLGSRELNLSLAQQRAQAVMAALVERGADPSRLTAIGIGSDRPIASNDTQAGRSQNRRVEIHVMRREQVAAGSPAQ